MGDTVIIVEGLGKLYRLGKKLRYGSLRESLVEAVSSPLRSLTTPMWRSQDSHSSDSRVGEVIWALREVSFEVKRGEVVGIIGPNGAGKTTILKILSRITEPSEGCAEIRGRIGALLEVGTGFHPELTGRENVYLSGAILGLKRAEIEGIFDEIVDFSGVEGFLDTPVKRYSTGMYLRLAFSVAAHLEADVLIVDEVLAVGDAAFQQKCVGKMREVAGSGRTVLFVSHNMAAVRSLCSRCLLLDSGRIREDGTVDSCIQAYLSQGNEWRDTGRIELGSEQKRSGSGRVRVKSFEARTVGGTDSKLRTGADAEFRVEYQAREQRRLLRLHVAVGVMDALGNNVFLCTTRMTERGDFRDLPPFGTIVCRVSRLPLIPGEYRVRVFLKDDEGLADDLNGVAAFVVKEAGDSGLVVIPSRAWGNIVVPHTWDVLPLEEHLECGGGRFQG